MTFVREHAELELKVGGLLDCSDHVDWLDRQLKQGDVVTIRMTPRGSASTTNTFAASTKQTRNKSDQ